MPVLISDLWTPDIWIPEMKEKQATFPSLFNAGVISRSAEMDAIATGAGTSVNIPFFKDITDQDDEIQVENTGPTTDNGQPSGKMVGVPLNRVTKNSVTALSGQVSGADPLGSIIGQLVERRLKQRQKTLVATMRGAFGTAGAKNAAASLSAVRIGGTTAEVFDESGDDATSDQLFSPDLFIDMKYLLGELANDLAQGLLLCHPNIKARLEKLDKDGFKEGRPSQLPFDITTYRGVPIFTSESLVRAGTTNGYVYDTYILARGVVGYGEKAQAGDVIDVASLQYDQNKDLNNEYIYDRTRFILHLNGMKWVGTPAGQSATNAELQTATNWNLVYQTANRVGAVAVRTNG